MSKLANVLDEMNESEKASIANRWAAAIYLQLGDYRNFLDRQRAGTWSQLYSGFLPNAVEDLIRVVADGCRQTADVSILFPSLCWLGLVSAIAGQGDLLSNLLKTDGQSIMGRWFLQTMAEACVYLGQYDAAIKLIYTAHSQPDDQDKEDRGQLSLTENPTGPRQQGTWISPWISASWIVMQSSRISLLHIMLALR
jgi:hypothetical protein